MRLLITGASGLLGSYLLREVQGTTDTVLAWSGTQVGERWGVHLRPVDLADTQAIRTAYQEAAPDVILHAGALARVGECLRDPDRAHQINASASATLAELAQTSGAHLILVSTDMVFDGNHAPYREEDPPCPLSVYGQSKWAGEQAVLAHPRTAIVRVSLLFGPTLHERPSFFDQQVNALRTGQPIRLFHDEWRTPLDLRTAAQALLALAQSPIPGILHIGGPERLSRWEMGQQLAQFLGIDPSGIISTSRNDPATSPAEPRPCDLSLDSSRWRSHFPDLPWPTWREALGELMRG